MPTLKNNLELLIDLVGIPSDTGSELERDIEEYLAKYLSSIPHLKEKGTFGSSAIPGDAHKRAVVWGLVKGAGGETVILYNHHDAVDTHDFGVLQKHAYDPYTVKKELKNLDHNPEVCADLASEDWLFGRGSCDMKAGAAIELNILHKYSERKDFKGNLLFISVPDEENISAGMCHAAKLLVELRDTHQLEYKLLLNTEPHERVDGNYTIYDGSVGKALVTVYVQGQKTHIGKIFQGLNPLLILSRIASNTEINSELSDADLGVVSPPPTWSFMRDFKEVYDASTPKAAGGYFSLLTLNSSPKKMLNKLQSICKRSFDDAIEHLQREYTALYPGAINKLDYQPQVMLYEELLATARLKDNTLTDKALNVCFATIKAGLENSTMTFPEGNFLIIKSLLEIAALNDPVVVIALSPPFYPAISSQKEQDHQETISKIMQCDLPFRITKEAYFLGISDLSYVGLQNEQDIVPFVETNMPLWRKDFYTIPFEEMAQLSIPSVIIGPWGKDLHKLTERVYIPDLIENTPLFIEKVIDTVLPQK